MLELTQQALSQGDETVTDVELNNSALKPTLVRSSSSNNKDDACSTDSDVDREVEGTSGLNPSLR